MEDSCELYTKNRKFSDFYLCFCGYARCASLHSFGPAVRPNYLIHVILKGRGRYRVRGNVYDLSAGEGFLIEPEVQTFYQADAEDPWTYLWLGFGGSRAGEYLADLGLGGGRRTFRCRHSEKLKSMVLDIMEHNTYTVENEFLRESFLYSFFAVLAAELEVDISGSKGSENIYVGKAIEYIQNNYSYGVRVQDIADYVGVSRGYLHTLFTGEVGMAPQDYLIRYRITRAAELLTTTDLPVEGIAQSCGYVDPLVFSKQFKNRMGTPPSVYRREAPDRRSTDPGIGKGQAEPL